MSLLPFVVQLLVVLISINKDLRRKNTVFSCSVHANGNGCFLTTRTSDFKTLKQTFLSRRSFEIVENDCKYDRNYW